MYAASVSQYFMGPRTCSFVISICIKRMMSNNNINNTRNNININNDNIYNINNNDGNSIRSKRKSSKNINNDIGNNIKRESEEIAKLENGEMGNINSQTLKTLNDHFRSRMTFEEYKSLYRMMQSIQVWRATRCVETPFTRLTQYLDVLFKVQSIGVRKHGD